MKIESLAIGFALFCICFSVALFISLIVEFLWPIWFPSLSIYAIAVSIGIWLFLMVIFSLILIFLINKGFIKIIK